MMVERRPTLGILAHAILVLGVLVVGGVLAVLAVLDVAGALAAPVVLLACLEPPQAPTASAAINTPES